MLYQKERTDLACALRWAVRYDLHEGVCNHFSMALPNDDGVMKGDRFLINPYGVHWSQMKASDIILVNDEGEVLDGTREVEPTAFFIHSRVHKAAPGAVAVLHTHQPYATALTIIEQGRLEMCEQNALMFDGRLSYDDDYEGLALDGAEGDRLARKLGNGQILMMASHGVMTTGINVAEAFTDLYYLERAARLQILAASTGKPLRTISDEIRAHARQQFVTERAIVAERHFRALGDILDREEPEYRH